MGFLKFSGFVAILAVGYYFYCQYFTTKFEYNSPNVPSLIKQLKEKLSKSEMQKEFSTFFQERSDEYLINWLRFGEGNLDKTMQKIIDMLKWREENDVDNLGKFNPGPDFDSFRCKVTGFTNDGFPVVYLPIGLFDFKKALEEGKSKDILKNFNHCFEIGFSLKNPKTGKKPDKFYLIPDFAKISLSQMSSIEVLSTFTVAASIYQSYYPLHSQTTLIVNASSYVSPFITILKGLFTSDIFQNLKIFTPEDTAGWQNEIFSVMDKSQMPPQIGGTSTKNIKWGGK